MKYRTPHYHPSRGAVLMLALVFVGLFAVTSIGILTLVDYQRKLSVKRVDANRALHVAEAGLNYYAWHLAHDPTDYQDGTGSDGPYVHEYKDSSGDTVGTFSLSITPPDASCLGSVVIESTGWTNSSPITTRKLRAQYARTSLTRFSFLTDANAWFGDTESIHGPMHSNGGVRMDGSHDNTVSSAKETYICTSDHGCSNESKPGIWGGGGTPTLWHFPEPTVDFNQITANLANLQTIAQSQGLFFGNLGQGYRVKFLSDGTFDLYRVKKLRQKVWSYNLTAWEHSTYDIEEDELIGTYTIPGGCGTIFIEDDVWVEGNVSGKVTLVAAKLPDVPSTRKNIIIHANILYTAQDGTSTLGLIAQNNILVPLYSAPDDLVLNGVLLAQNGRVARYYYESDLTPYHLRNSLTLYGAILTKNTWTWSWVNSSEDVISGYVQTNTTFDPHLVSNPPPGFPTSGDYRLVKWEEITEK